MEKAGFSKEDVQDILREQQAGFVKIIEEIKKPDPVMAAKAQREQELLDRQRDTRLKSLIAQGAAKEASQARCPHRKNNGDPEAPTAVHHPPLSSDGMVHPICVECGKEFTPYRPSSLEMSGMVVQ